MSTFPHQHMHPESQASACAVSSTCTALCASKIQIPPSLSAQFQCHPCPMKSSLLCPSWNPLIPIALYPVPLLILIPCTLYYYIAWTCLWSVLDYICLRAEAFWLICLDATDSSTAPWFPKWWVHGCPDKKSLYLQWLYFFSKNSGTVCFLFISFPYLLLLFLNGLQVSGRNN